VDDASCADNHDRGHRSRDLGTLHRSRRELENAYPDSLVGGSVDQLNNDT